MPCTPFRGLVGGAGSRLTRGSFSIDAAARAAYVARPMISRLFRTRPKPSVSAPADPATPPDTAVWAIGDIHGRLDLLAPLVEAVLADAAGSTAARKVVVFLGDYIDRGPDSRGVIRFLCDLPRDRGVEWRFLRGNHEETMLAFLEDPSVGAQWCEYGGDAALASYGFEPPTLRHRAEGWAHISADLDHLLAADEKAFLNGLETLIVLGDYCFVHAGLRPGVALEDQSDEDMLWIRRTFLDSEAAFEKVVVHGHTPTREVHIDHRRIGVDTKAYDSGVLTALRLEGRTRGLIQTSQIDGGLRISRTAV